MNYKEGEMFNVAFRHFIWNFQENFFRQLLCLQVAEALHRLTT